MRLSTFTLIILLWNIIAVQEVFEAGEVQAHGWTEGTIRKLKGLLFVFAAAAATQSNASGSSPDPHSLTQHALSFLPTGALEDHHRAQAWFRALSLRQGKEELHHIIVACRWSCSSKPQWPAVLKVSTGIGKIHMVAVATTQNNVSAKSWATFYCAAGRLILFSFTSFFFSFFRCCCLRGCWHWHHLQGTAYSFWQAGAAN